MVISFYFAHTRGTINCKARYLANPQGTDEPEANLSSSRDVFLNFSIMPKVLSGTVILDLRTTQTTGSPHGRISGAFLYFDVDDSSSDPSSDLVASTITITEGTVDGSVATGYDGSGQEVFHGSPTTMRFTNASSNDVWHSAMWYMQNVDGARQQDQPPPGQVLYPDRDYSVTIPEWWFYLFPNTSIAICYVHYGTRIGNGDVVGQDAEASFRIRLSPDSPTAKPDAPGVSVTISTDNETIQGWNVPVQNYSYANLTINTPAAKYGTSIRSYEIQCPDFSQQIECAQQAVGGTTQFRTPVFTTAGNYTISVRALDARGLRSEWQTYTVNVLTYTKPLISSCRIVRCERDGTESESGTHAKITCVASYSHVGPNNVRGVGAAYCVTGSNAFSSEVTLTANGDVYTGIIGIDPESTTDGLLNPSSSYDVRITINDMLVGAAFYYTLNTESFTFHMMDGGEGVAFGKASEKAGYLELAADWSIWMDKYNKDIIDLIVPIGSIKIFTDNTDPNVLYGGTKWTKLKDRFLLGSGDTYTLGDTGGSAEIPAHTHNLSASATSDGGSTWVVQVINNANPGANSTGPVNRTGGDPADAVNNLPPYLVVNIWKRIY